VGPKFLLSLFNLISSGSRISTDKPSPLELMVRNLRRQGIPGDEGLGFVARITNDRARVLEDQ